MRAKQNLFTKTAILMLIVLLQISCKPLLKTYLKTTGNLKKAKKETPASVIAYLKKQNATYDGAFVCQDKKGFRYFQDSVSNAIPSVLIFDKNFTNFVLDEKCPWSILPGLDSLNNSTYWKKNNDLSFQKMTAQLKTIDGAFINYPETGTYDVYVFYVWAKYAPKLSQAIIKEIKEYFNNPHNNIYVGSVNRDLQEGWE